MNRSNRGLPFRTEAILTAAAVAASLAISAPALAQRGSRSDSGSGSSSGSRSEGSSRHESSAPSRSECAPRHESYSSSRSESAPRRDYSSPSRQDSYSRRDYSSSRRDDYAPRRDYSTRYDDSSRRDYSYRRDDSTARRDYSTRDNTYRRDDSSPRRDYSTQRGSDRSDDWLPRRDSSASRDRAPRVDTHPDSARAGRDQTDGSHDIFNRSHPSHTQDHGTDTGTIRRDNAAGRRPDSSSHDSPRGFDPAPQRDRAHELFVRTAEGRRYQNGIVLRERYYAPSSFSFFFTGGYCYYPFYAPVFVAGDCYYSPYSFYYGCGPSYIYRRHCFYYPPPSIFIEVPIYVHDECRGYDSDLNDYYLGREHYDSSELREIGVQSAIDDIREAFRFGEVETLVNHTEPGVRIAIFRRGNYEYSMEANDYLDATRDAMRTMETIQFDLYRIRRRAEGVFVVSGKHVYRNREGERRTVYVSYVLEHLNGRWVLTQVGNAPDRIQEPR